MEKIVKYQAVGGKIFDTEENCIEYEIKLKKQKEEEIKWESFLASKIGEYKPEELMLGGFVLLNKLPFTAPWLTPYGACYISVTDIRRTTIHNPIQFQIADEENVPYAKGEAWVKAEAFHNEWPD